MHKDAASEHAIEVAAGLIFRNGKLLLTQRPADAHLGGLWEFPGGKLEPDESYEACLARELKEELGIDVCAGELIESVTHAYPEKTVHIHFFKCNCGESEPRPLGCAAVAWVTANELGQYAFPEADAVLLQRLRNAPELWT